MKELVWFEVGQIHGSGVERDEEFSVKEVQKYIGGGRERNSS